MSSVLIVHPTSTVASCGEPHLEGDALAPRASIDVRVAQNDARGRVTSALELVTVVIDGCGYCDCYSALGLSHQDPSTSVVVVRHWSARDTQPD